MLAIATFLNYADRGSLSVVAPILSERFDIRPAQMGVLLSAFFWTYTAAQPLAGSIAQRFDVRHVLPVGLALWAAATMLSGFATSFLGLLLLRLALGLGESVMYPCNAGLLARGLPDAARGRANAAMSVSIAMGPSAGTLIGGLLLAGFGWQAVFFCLGAVTLLWLLPWYALPLRLPPASRGGGPGYRQLLGERSLWSASLGEFCFAYQSYLLLTWLPLFLVKGQHYSLTAMAWIGAGIYAGHAVAAIAAGTVSDLIIARGADVTRVRKGFVIAGMAAGGAAMALAAASSGWWVIGWLAINAACNGIAHPMMFTIGQTLGGPEGGARWMGVQNFIGNLAGIVAPIATGLIVQHSGGYTPAFIVAAVISALGVVCWATIRRVAPVDWVSDPPARYPRRTA